MIDELAHVLAGHRAVERHGVAVPLAEVVTGPDPGVAGTQAGGEIAITRGADAAGHLAGRHQREPPAGAWKTATGPPDGQSSAAPGSAVQAAITPSRRAPVISCAPARD